MEDEFLLYLRSKIRDRLIMSFDNTDLLLWGARKDNRVKLLGLTLNIGVKDMQTIESKLKDPENQTTNVMHVASSLSRRIGSTFLSIVYSLSGDDYFIVTDPEDPTNWSASLKVTEKEMVGRIQTFFKTKLGDIGTAKAVNKATSDWFHAWARANLPREYVRVNIDGLILDKSQRPNILLETKRSFYRSDSWKPWQEDSRNYYLQHLLATKANLSFWTVYHKKGSAVTDETDVALFMISEVSLDTQDKWITYRRLNVNAYEVLNRANEIKLSKS